MTTIDGPVTLTPYDKGTIVTAVGFAIYNGIWLGVLCAVAVALVLLSTPQQRHGAIFLIQSLAFPMAICSAILHVVLNSQIIVTLVTKDRMSVSLGAFTALRIATKVFEMFTPLVCDMTLLFKVASFYPSTLYPRRWQRIRPLLVLIVLAVGRLAPCILCIVAVPQTTRTSFAFEGNIPDFNFVGYDASLYDLIEYGLQFFFCLYACVVLMCKLWTMQSSRRLASAAPRRKRKLRFLFEATVMTFFLPIVAQLGAVVSFATGEGVIYSAFAYSNIYLSILCSVLATSWSTIRASQKRLQLPTLLSTSGGSGRALFPHQKNATQRWPYLRRKDDEGDDSPAAAPGQIENDRASTISVEQVARELETLESQMHQQTHEQTLLLSLFNDEESEAMEVLRSTVHQASLLDSTNGGTSSDPSLPQRLPR